MKIAVFGAGTMGSGIAQVFRSEGPHRSDVCFQRPERTAP